MGQTTTKTNDAIAEDLKTRYLKLKEEQPRMYPPDLARELGVSEVELLACKVGDGVTRLVDDPEAILRDVISLGEVMALTRNESGVHESKGVYENADFVKKGGMYLGLFIGSTIDLHLFINHWAYSFAETVQAQTGARKSLQFFDKEGRAVHKVHLTGKSNVDAYDSLVEKHRNTQQDRTVVTESYAPEAATKPDEKVDWKGLRAAWEKTKNVHDIGPMLNKFEIGRVQAFRKVGQDFAYLVKNDSARRVLELARDRECEIAVFIGNRGCVQAYTGTVKKLAEFGPWYNVLDPMFDMHLKEENIASTWVVKRTTDDGIVTSLEVFNKDDEAIVSFFGKSTKGASELELWREIIAEIPTKESGNAT